MRLRRSLFWFSFATAVPVIAFALLAAAFVVQHENESLVSAAKARNLATMSAVDAEVQGTIHTLQALAVTPSIARDDLVSFHVLATAVLRTQPSWLNLFLTDTEGRQLLNASRPWGAALPQASRAPKSIEAAVRTLRPAIEDLTSAPLFDDRLAIPIRVPVVRDGKAVYVLTAVMAPESFQRLMAKQKVMDGWVSGLVDKSGRLIARVPAKPPGVEASPDYLANVREAHEGWYRGRTLEGVDAYTAFLRSDLTGWTLGYAVPTPLVYTGAIRASWLMGAGILLSLLAAVLIGYWLSRGIAGPMSRLADAAATMGEGRQPAPVDSSIEEVQRLSQALVEAWHAIDRRDQQLRGSEAELREQADELRRADENKRQFLALVSHELRNPLAPLRNGIELLGRSTDPRLVAATQAMMGRQVIHLTRLIDDLLDVTRIDRGQLELRRQRVALETVLATAIEAVRPAIDAKHQVLVVEPTAQAAYVDADPVRLGQVVTNLVNNASRFTPERGHITLATAVRDTEVSITVEDDGVGFREEDRQRIFDRFIQLHGSGTQTGGLGIGLTIVRSLVEMHGGRVEARSAGIGRGATFTVTLPRVDAPHADAAVGGTARAAAEGRRVLVVDDNVDAASSLAQVLRLEGYDAREAYDGRSALELAGRFEPDVAFIDLNMPGLSGSELAQAIRAQPWADRMRLVALTGMGQDSDIAATRAAGFHHHLTKPAAPDDVLRLASGQRVVDGFSPKASAAR